MGKNEVQTKEVKKYGDQKWEIDKFQIQVQGKVIPLIEEDPVKCLGKWYDTTLNDRSRVSRTERQTEELLKKIECSGLQAKFKGSLFQHGLQPRLMWLRAHDISGRT